MRIRIRGGKRAARWIEGLRQRAEATAKENPGSPEGLYFDGVLIAISVTQGTMAWPWKIDKGSFDRSRGFHDGIALLKMVDELGTTPEGEFTDLLSGLNSARIQSGSTLGLASRPGQSN